MAAKEVKFVVLGKPFGKQRPKFARAGQYVKTYTPDETVNYENLVRLMYQQAAKGLMFDSDAMLDMRIKAYYAIPKSDSRKLRERKLAGEVRPAKKPDIDNVIKVVADALNTVAYRDDTQIVDCQCRKFYSENPRVEVTIKEIPG